MELSDNIECLQLRLPVDLLKLWSDQQEGSTLCLSTHLANSDFSLGTLSCKRRYPWLDITLTGPCEKLVTVIGNVYSCQLGRIKENDNSPQEAGMAPNVSETSDNREAQSRPLSVAPDQRRYNTRASGNLSRCDDKQISDSLRDNKQEGSLNVSNIAEDTAIALDPVQLGADTDDDDLLPTPDVLAPAIFVTVEDLEGMHVRNVGAFAKCFVCGKATQQPWRSQFLKTHLTKVHRLDFSEYKRCVLMQDKAEAIEQLQLLKDRALPVVRKSKAASKKKKSSLKGVRKKPVRKKFNGERTSDSYSELVMHSSRNRTVAKTAGNMQGGQDGNGSDGLGAVAREDPDTTKAGVKNPVLLCPACDARYHSPRALEEHVHLQHKHEPNFLDICAQIDDQILNRKSNKQAVDKSLHIACLYCGMERKGHQAVVHVQRCHSEEPDFASTLDRMQEIHLAQRKEKRRQKDQKRNAELVLNGRRLTCRFCHKGGFLYRSSKAYHEKSCEKNPDRKPQFRCTVCAVIFSSMAALNEHRTTHGEKNFTCEQCGQSYRNKSNLILHRRSKHKVATRGSIRYHKCQYCSKEFYRKDKLKDHQAKHQVNKDCMCDLCGKRFKQAKDVKKHQKAVHFDKYPYYCPRCGHGVSRQVYLQTHVCGRVKRQQTTEQILLCNGEGTAEEQPANPGQSQETMTMAPPAPVAMETVEELQALAPEYYPALGSNMAGAGSSLPSLGQALAGISETQTLNSMVTVAMDTAIAASNPRTDCASVVVEQQAFQPSVVVTNTDGAHLAKEIELPLVSNATGNEYSNAPMTNQLQNFYYYP